MFPFHGEQVAGWPARQLSQSRPQHYTMITMKNKTALVVRRHRWNVLPAGARAIQDELRQHWIGEDRLLEIRTVAGLETGLRAKQKESS